MTITLGAIAASIINATSAPPEVMPSLICLATTVYIESRGESQKGRRRVAEVIHNRVESPDYPDTFCEVVKQPYQFSFFNGRDRYHLTLDNQKERDAFDSIVSLSLRQIKGEPPQHDLLYFHAKGSAPDHFDAATRIERIGNHVFYSIEE